MTDLVFRKKRRLGNLTLVHQVCGKTVWASAGRRVLKKSAGNDWTDFCRFPFQWKQDSLGSIRPVARLTRADKCNVFQNSAGRVLGIRGGRVFELSDDGSRAIASIQGDSVLQGCLCEDRHGWTYLGEYFRNRDRGPVRIHRFCPQLRQHEVAHEFAVGEIRHVHGVFADPFDADSLWVTTGDHQGECFLFHTSDRFRSLDRIGDGSQTWRAVTLHFTETHISWITDSHISQNYACRVRRGTEDLEVGHTLSSSAWYGARISNGLYLAFTTVEPGAGIQVNDSAILVSSDAFNWHIIKSFKKDAWRPMSLFKFGVISCAHGTMKSDEVYLSGEGLVGFDGVSIVGQVSTSDVRRVR